jgi:aldose 1-epimerase
MYAMISNPGRAQRGARRFTLLNSHDMRITISEHGAALVSWWAPDRYGRMADVLRAEPGAALPSVPGWHGELEAGGAGLRLRPAAGHGIPGDDIEVHYRLNDDGSLAIGYRAGFGACPCFNLNGGRAGVGDHILQIDADRYLEIGPGGALRDAAVGGTPFDFRRPAAIGPRLRWPHAQTGFAGGFDHCYQVGAAGEGGADGARQVASIHDPGSGRRLDVSTTEPALHFYSNDRPEGERRAAFCLGTGMLRPSGAASAAASGLAPGSGGAVRHTTVYRLSLQSPIGSP